MVGQLIEERAYSGEWLCSPPLVLGDRGQLTRATVVGIRAQRWSRRATPRFTVVGGRGGIVGAGAGSPSTPKSSPQRRQ
jgi:hypothetical protein